MVRTGLYESDDFPEFFGRGNPFDDRAAFERTRDLQRDFDQERRDFEADLERERRDDARGLSAEAKKRLEDALKETSVEDIRDLINNANLKVTPMGTISSRSRPSGRDTIRRSGQFTMQGFDLPVKKPRKKNKKHCKNLSQCLRQANAELRTKKGAIRKGKSQADIMRRAQKLLRKMS